MKRMIIASICYFSVCSLIWANFCPQSIALDNTLTEIIKSNEEEVQECAKGLVLKTLKSRQLLSELTLLGGSINKDTERAVCLMEQTIHPVEVNTLTRLVSDNTAKYQSKCSELENLDKELNKLLEKCHFEEASNFLSQNQEADFSLVKTRKSLCENQDFF